MSVNITEVIIALVSAVAGGGLYKLMRVRADRRMIEARAERIDADAAKTYSQIALSLLKPMEQEIDRLTRRVGELESRVQTLTAGLKLAETLLIEHGIPLPPDLGGREDTR